MVTAAIGGIVMETAGSKLRSSTGHGPRRERMLMSRTILPTRMVLILILLAVRLLVSLVLILLRQPHLHKPLVTGATIQHYMLPLLMALAEYAIRVVRGLLLDGRPRGGGGIIAVGASSIIDWRSAPYEVAWMVVLVIMLGVVKAPSSRLLLELVGPICHLTSQVDEVC